MKKGKNNFMKIRRLSHELVFSLLISANIFTKRNSRVFITHLESIITPTQNWLYFLSAFSFSYFPSFLPPEENTKFSNGGKIMFVKWMLWNGIKTINSVFEINSNMKSWERKENSQRKKKEAHNFLSLFSCMMVPQLSNYSNVHRHHQQRLYVCMMFFNVGEWEVGNGRRKSEGWKTYYTLRIYCYTHCRWNN